MTFHQIPVRSPFGIFLGFVRSVPLHDVSLHTTPQRYLNKTMSDSHLNPSGGNNNGNSHLPSSNTASEDAVTNDTLSVEVTTTTTGSRSANSLAAVRTASGPVVKCVLLKHMRSSGRDVHPHLDKSVLLLRAREKEEEKEEELNTKPAAISTTPTEEELYTVANHHPHHPHHREVLTELIEECVVDTTPGKNEVQKLLGGNSFTFIGQYPDEGIVLMARADQFHDLDMIDDLTIRELKNFIRESGLGHIIDLTTVVDHADLIQAVKDAQLPLNPHRLQPPFDDCPIRGDILLMRVADDPNEEEDDDNDDEENEDDDAGIAKMSAAIHQAMQQVKSAMEVPNDEFFLDYTKEEYIAFASRTDIVAEPMDDDDEDDEDGEDEDEEDVDDEDEEDRLDDEEEEKHLMLNLILSELIKSFREDNGRGPDAEELLDLRARVAEQLKLELPPPAAPIPDEERKRKTIDDDHHASHSTSPSPKKVKFTPDILAQHDENDDDDDDIDATENGNNVKDDPNDEAPDDR